MLDRIPLPIEQVDPEEKVKVYAMLEKDAKPCPDYYTMVVLSTIIASFGLIGGQTAVIIGAMLVAPLMSPVIAISLAMVHGDLPLFYRSVEAELKGILLAVGIALMLTIVYSMFFGQITAPHAEIMNRTKPTLLDLGIALAAGGAGAYAIARRMNASLIGVAISTALLPPLCVVGIGLALYSLEISIGAFLLFFANLIAINVASSFVFWVLGFGPKWSKVQEEGTIKAIRTSLVLLGLVSIPLAYIMVTSIQTAKTRELVGNTIKNNLLGVEGAELRELSIEERGGKMVVRATVEVPHELSFERVSEIKRALETNLKRHGEVELELKMDVYRTVEVR
ncbi:MAG: TIGR00341 family protein [Candidatus Micrarchaeia archaeon]